VAGVGSQGLNDFGEVGYSGPRPPPGPAHLYFFRLYALDTARALPPRRRKADLLKALAGAPPRAGGSRRALPATVTEWRWPTGALVAVGASLAVLPPLAWRLNRQGALPVRPDASLALPGAQPLAIGAQVRYVSPWEETRHAPRAAKGYAQLVPSGETR
jgi:hypothetical protein